MYDLPIVYFNTVIVLPICTLYCYPPCTDIDSSGNEVEEDRPSGADAEHRQPSKTINAKAQQRKRAEKRRRKLSEKFHNAVVKFNTVNDILERNSAIEDGLKSKRDGGSLQDATVSQFLALNVNQLKDFIHARKFNDKTFQEKKLTCEDGKLNKTRFKGQTIESIESDCSNKEPCLVWLAWRIRSDPLLLKKLPMPEFKDSFPTPKFTVVYAGPEERKLPSDYLRNDAWVAALKSVVKGIDTVPIDDEMMAKADQLALALEPRLDCHIADRVDACRQNHWTLQFTRDNIPPMAAAMCLVGHIVDNLETYGIDERVLHLPLHEMFQIIAGDLSNLEGCYLYYNACKTKWVRSGKTSGDGKDACFDGRGKKHISNSTKIEEMRRHNFYQRYPAKGVENLGAIEGNFENLVMYCGMAYDKRGNIAPLCSESADDSLFVWSKETIGELKKRGDVQKLQLHAVAYLWEICYDLALAKHDNVSESPGYESLGLRVNKKKRTIGHIG